jgi:hypothetical protein
MSLFSPAQPRRAETRLSPGDVLTSLRGFTQRTEYTSPLRLLRPCWAKFLSIRWGISGCSRHVTAVSRGLLTCLHRAS